MKVPSQAVRLMSTILSDKVFIDFFLAGFRQALEEAKVYDNPILDGVEFNIDDEGAVHVDVQFTFETTKK